MNRKALFSVYISLFLCHILFMVCGLSAQVPSQLHSPPAVEIKADSQEKAGELYHLIGHCEVIYSGMRLTADRMDYNADTGAVTANGNVHFSRPEIHEDIWATQGDYNLRDDTGSFFHVVGSVGARVQGRASLLSTTNPFIFEADRVDKTDSDTYKVRNATITVCSLPDPTWSFAASEATIHPSENAILYHSKLRVLKLPVFYFPFFYRSLRNIPRSSGFLTPTFGNNSRLGTFFGDSFFWAINRSADAEIGAQFLSKRGWSQTAAFRMRHAAGSYLNFSYYGVVDRGFGPQKIDQGGRTASAQGVFRLPQDIRAVVDINYLNSLTFRQAFTQTFNEAVFTENHSAGFVTKNLDSMSFDAVFSRLQDYQSTAPNDIVTISRLPQLDIDSVERPVWQGVPVWLSWNDSIGMVSRSEPTLPGGQGQLATSLLERFVFNPRVTVPLDWKEFHLTPVFGYRARHYGSRSDGGRISSAALNDASEELSMELDFPPLSRVFRSAGPLNRGPLKHVIEPKVTFHYVNGVRDFGNMLLFDEEDLVTNTRNLEFSLTNRLYAKRQADSPAKEILTWEVKQQYYFDPNFGGALKPGVRNVFLPTLQFSGDAFLDGPRRFSPVVSVLRFRPFAHYDVELRQDYDTTLRRFTNASYSGNVNWGKAFASAGEFLVRPSIAISAPSDQLHFTVGYGSQGRTGWNGVFTGAYDARSGFLQYTAFQVSYNNNCCGVSFEYRRFALGPVRNENQFRMAFSLANIGTFGNLKKQERLF
jgi:LPS-assembly protein